MLTTNQKKEQISKGYIRILAAQVGFSCEEPMIDMDSVDVIICAKGKLNENSSLASPRIEVQLKATSSPQFDESNLIFDLPIKNYDDLRATTMCPRILMVLVLPEQEEQWVTHDENALVAKKCAYWVSLNNEPETNNEATIRVKIPRSNLVSPESMHDLMQRASQEEDLG